MKERKINKTIVGPTFKIMCSWRVLEDDGFHDPTCFTLEAAPQCRRQALFELLGIMRENVECNLQFYD